MKSQACDEPIRIIGLSQDIDYAVTTKSKEVQQYA